MFQMEFNETIVNKFSCIRIRLCLQRRVKKVFDIKGDQDMVHYFIRNIPSMLNVFNTITRLNLLLLFSLQSTCRHNT